MGKIQNEPVCQEPLDIQLEKERRERKQARKEARIQLWKESGMNVDEMLEERAKRKAEKRNVAQEEVENSVDEVVEVPAKKKAKKQQVQSYCTEQEKSEYLKKHNLTVEGRDSETFMPFRKFEDAQLPDYCKPAIENFTCPTPIQGMCMPIAMSGRDLIGVAETGSGKTLAFGLPSIYQIKKGEGIKVLVMSPTRELTMQIAKVYESFTDSVACIYGGASKEPQAKQLRKKPSIVVATPGRLIDFISEGKCDLSKVSYVVLDEADRMLDIGFEEPIRKILSEVKGPHQTLMFTATWPATIQALASTFMNDPVKVVFGKIELAANKRIKQVVDIIRNANEKPTKLQSLMSQYHVDGNRILVFVLYKKEAPQVHELLTKKGYKVVSLHGNCSQAQRTSAIESFRNGTTPILVATDVAARGLDVDDVEYVINYSMPLNIEDYVHRIGRTARAGKNGVAHTFFSPTHDKLLGFQLASILKDANQEVPEHLLTYHARPTKVVEKTCNISEVGPASKIVFDDSD